MPLTEQEYQLALAVHCARMGLLRIMHEGDKHSSHCAGVTYDRIDMLMDSAVGTRNDTVSPSE